MKQIAIKKKNHRAVVYAPLTEAIREEEANDGCHHLSKD